MRQVIAQATRRIDYRSGLTLKFLCNCGNEIRDQTDYLSYKAYFYADQDFDEVTEGTQQPVRDVSKLLRPKRTSPEEEQRVINLALDSVSRPFVQYSRHVYQCLECGRVYIEDDERNLQSFLPEDRGSVRRVLLSTEGEKWRGWLRGNWSLIGRRREGGAISWSAGKSGDRNEQFDEWEVLESRYRSLFDELSGRDLLRRATLTKHDQTIHTWQGHSDRDTR
jgi:hypothetical protein